MQQTSGSTLDRSLRANMLVSYPVSALYLVLLWTFCEFGGEQTCCSWLISSCTDKTKEDKTPSDDALLLCCFIQSDQSGSKTTIWTPCQERATFLIILSCKCLFRSSLFTLQNHRLCWPLSDCQEKGTVKVHSDADTAEHVDVSSVWS